MKRLLSLLVAIVMVISVVPATFAAGDIGGTPDVGLWDVEELTNISATANLVAGDDNGCYYLWTATEDGKVIVTSSAAAGYAYNIVMTNGDKSVSGTALEMEVAKGDEILIQVVATGEGYPAGSVTISGSYYVEPTPDPEPETGIVITAQPVDFGYVVGGNATFTVEATGATKYVWYWRKTSTAAFAVANAFTGYKTATLTVPVKTESYTGYEFYCKLTDAEGNTVDTNIVSLQPKVADITITTYGANDPVVEGKTASYVIIATGAVKYQWMYSSNGGSTWGTVGVTETNGADTGRFYVKAWQSNAGTLYRCKMWDADGAFTYSNTFTMKVADNPLVGEPLPTEVWAIKGKDASVTFNVTGAEIAKYQWQTSRNGVNWGNTTLPTYNKATFTLAAYGSRENLYLRCIAIAKDGNKIISTPVQLKIEAVPFSFVLQPTNITTPAGKAAVFTAAIGSFDGELTYRWQMQKPGESTWTNWGSTNGGYTDTLSVPGQARFNGYRFRLYVKDAVGHYTYSEKVQLTVQ